MGLLMGGGGGAQVSFVKKSVVLTPYKDRNRFWEIKSRRCCLGGLEGVGEQLRGTGFGPLHSRHLATAARDLERTKEAPSVFVRYRVPPAGTLLSGAHTASTRVL